MLRARLYSSPEYSIATPRAVACSSAPGDHKLKLKFVGKATHARAHTHTHTEAFRNLAPAALPLSCKKQKNELMDSLIFRGFFFVEFPHYVTFSLLRPPAGFVGEDNRDSGVLESLPSATNCL